MLAHSPPLPLTNDYRSEGGISAEDEEGILLALEQRHRVRHLRLLFPIEHLQKLVKAIDEEFPILEYLILEHSAKNSTALVLPETLQAPNLGHLALRGFACPIRPRLHPTAAGLVTLSRDSRDLLFIPVPNGDVEKQLRDTPITTHITLPNLRFFWLGGVSAYLEALVCRITTPRFENLQIRLFKQPTFSVPLLAQLMNTTANLMFNNAVIGSKGTYVLMFFHGADKYAFVVRVDCWHLDWQVSSVAQICNALSQAFTAVEHLALEHEVHGRSSEEHNDVDRIEWRNLLRPFSNVKTLRVEDGLVEQLSHCLRLEDGELPLELLPELQELTYSGSGDSGDGFPSFIDARQNAGRPVIPVRRSSSTNHSGSSFKAPGITSAGCEPGKDVDT
ncbi:hypothetical protein BGY98DRAFT_1188235 [Russula aff. rugulosa BPL654]|nr:hypothetical protein BGY98DRAFT_1188235 [Russula aff. rugulosa BPL654]